MHEYKNLRFYAHWMSLTLFLMYPFYFIAGTMRKNWIIIHRAKV